MAFRIDSKGSEIICDMRDDCRNQVTHIGEKGYVYCTKHVVERKGVERTRKLAKWELGTLQQCGSLPRYERGPKLHKEVS